MEDKVLGIVSSILGVDKSELTLESSPDDIISWDSLMQMNIIMAIEEEFDLTFTEEDIFEMLSVKSILDKLNENL